jgi:proline racemase
VSKTAICGRQFCYYQCQRSRLCLRPDEARDLAETGIKITNAANEQFGFHHPEHLDWRHISFCEIAAPLKEEQGQVVGKNTVVIQPGKLDRSPTGTGISARMALLHAKGQLHAGDTFIGESIIGSRFQGYIRPTTRLGQKAAIYPEILGQTWITGTHQPILDPSDPWPEDYRLADTWPMFD